MRLMRLKTVVFPAPFGPMSVNTSPRRTSKVTSLTASTPPKRTLMFFAERRMSSMSAKAVRLRERLLPLEQALAVEREKLEVGANLQPATIQAQRLEEHERDQHGAEHHGLQAGCLADGRRQPILSERDELRHRDQKDR